MSALSYSCLKGLRVVIVEDEATLCLMIEDNLVEAGATVLGVAKNVPEALELVERTRANTIALNDKLRCAISGAVAEHLDQLGVCYFVVTDESILPDSELSDAPRVTKGFTPQTLKAAGPPNALRWPESHLW